MNQQYVDYFIGTLGEYQYNYPITFGNQRIVLDSEFTVKSRFMFDHLQAITDRYAGIEDVKIFDNHGTIIFLGTEQNINTKNLGVCGGIYPLDDTK